MQRIHDLGGMQGFGPVEVEPDEPVFHEDWERRIFGLMGSLMTKGLLNGPTFRHSIERMDPAHYLTSSYYEHWMTGVATLLVENGVVSAEELDRRAGGFPLSRPATVGPDDVPTAAPGEEPRFSVNDEVRVRASSFTGHTRCPDYVRGRRGTIVRVDDAFPIPELEAHRDEVVREFTYGVRFEASELWGDGGGDGEAVSVDLYESYLEAQA